MTTELYIVTDRDGKEWTPERIVEYLQDLGVPGQFNTNEVYGFYLDEDGRLYITDKYNTLIPVSQDDFVVLFNKSRLGEDFRLK